MNLVWKFAFVHRNDDGEVDWVGLRFHDSAVTTEDEPDPNNPGGMVAVTRLRLGAEVKPEFLPARLRRFRAARTKEGLDFVMIERDDIPRGLRVQHNAELIPLLEQILGA
jgi:hypothetical protein